MREVPNVGTFLLRVWICTQVHEHERLQDFSTM